MDSTSGIIALISSLLVNGGLAYKVLHKVKRDDKEQDQTHKVQATEVELHHDAKVQAQWERYTAQREKLHNSDVARLDAHIAENKAEIKVLQEKERTCQILAAQQGQELVYVREQLMELKRYLEQQVGHSIGSGLHKTVS